MWLGKVSIIMYLFSIGLIFSGYYIDQVFGEDLFTDSTSMALEELISNNDMDDESINVELIFGDFITGVRVLFGIMTGDVLTNAFQSFPNFNYEYSILARILFTTSTAFLWINLITGRDL
jgi:hypothetical protein